MDLIINIIQGSLIVLIAYFVILFSISVLIHVIIRSYYDAKISCMTQMKKLDHLGSEPIIRKIENLHTN